MDRKNPIIDDCQNGNGVVVLFNDKFLSDEKNSVILRSILPSSLSDDDDIDQVKETLEDIENIEAIEQFKESDAFVQQIKE